MLMSVLDKTPIFILTYGRAKEQSTLKTLHKLGITENIYLVISDDDPQIEQYRNKYSNLVKVFNRYDIQEDLMDNVEEKSGVISARNYCFNLAKSMDSKYFIMLDDDYNVFFARYVKNGKLKHAKFKSISNLFEASLELLANTSMDCFCWAQGGDFIGGANGGMVKDQFRRKAMNIYFWKTDSPIRFMGRINEDTNMYTHYGKIGRIVLTNSFLMINQPKTQKTENGMTNLYTDHGTYMKSMYSVIQEPAIVSLTAMGEKHLRIHHLVNWNACCPKIMSERFKK